jgi:Insulin-induced protein (INSIG)
VLWYLVDRSKPGFIFSTVVGVVGTFALLEINPNILPSPATQAPKVVSANVTSHKEGFTSFISQESIGIWTWIASVLFCSCVCFGNIGRRLALGHQSAVS